MDPALKFNLILSGPGISINRTIDYSPGLKWNTVHLSGSVRKGRQSW